MFNACRALEDVERESRGVACICRALAVSLDNDEPDDSMVAALQNLADQIGNISTCVAIIREELTATD